MAESDKQTVISGSKKAFTLKDYQWLGWDLDGTLMRYRLEPFHKMLYKCFVRFLVEQCGYDESLLQVPLNEEISKKGVLIDKAHGNLLKIDAHGFIERAYHGTKLLTREQIKQLYGSKKHPSKLAQEIVHQHQHQDPHHQHHLEPAPDVGGFDHSDNEDAWIHFGGSNTDEIWSASTFFEVTVLSLFATLVDLQDTNPPCPTVTDYAGHTANMVKALTFNFAVYQQGWYFREFEANPQLYLFPQPKVKQWLLTLRTRNHKLLLITNSFPEYTNVLMRYSYGEDWTSLFDFIITLAKKPGFFDPTCNALFYEWKFDEKGNIATSATGVDQVELGKWYSGGNAMALTQCLNIQSACYFGDHLHYDVYSPKKHLNWATVAIVEELEDLMNEKQNTQTTTNSNHPSDNPYWGSFFFRGDGDGHTYWTNTIKQHSEVVVTSMEHFAEYDYDHVHHDAHDIFTTKK